MHSSSRGKFQNSLPSVAPILLLLLLLPQIGHVVNATAAATKIDDVGKPPPADPVVVMTSYGRLQGFVHTPSDSLDRKIDVFFGIPFAEAPIGARRFEKPLPPASWPGTIRMAVDPPPACIPHARPEMTNYTGRYSEDCLFLNVFAPHQDEQSTNNVTASTLFPILVMIHGGGYEFGSSLVYGNFDLLGSRFVTKGLVFVSIQYRLGVLGFGTTGDAEMPGNFGIWDQIAALHYVRDNILAFGGDPQRVTIAGYSAGAGSVSLLNASPRGRDLFRQTIEMSASAMSASGSGTFVMNTTKQLARAVGCLSPDNDGTSKTMKTQTESQTIRECLRAKTVEELFDGVEKIGAAPLSYNPVRFGPNRADPELFPRDYPELIYRATPKASMQGFNELDSLLYTLIHEQNTSLHLLALTEQQIEHFDESDLENFIRQFVVKEEYFHDHQNVAEIVAELVNFYVNNVTMGEEQRDNAFYLRRHAMVHSDLLTVVPTLWEAHIRILAKSSIFLYENKYFNPGIFPRRAAGVHAAYHTYDQSLLIDNQKILNSQDRMISEFWVQSVVNFVKNGDPSTDAVKWEPTRLNITRYDQIPSVVSHMQIDRPAPAQTIGMREQLKRVQFWMNMRQKYPQFDLVRGVNGAPTVKLAIVLLSISIFFVLYLIANPVNNQKIHFFLM